MESKNIVIRTLQISLLAQSLLLTTCHERVVSEVVTLVLPLQVSKTKLPKSQEPVCDIPHKNKSKLKRSLPKPTCSIPADNLTAGRFASGSSSREDGQLPPWINITLAQRGQEFAKQQIKQLSFSHIYGLVFSIIFPDGRDVLLMTKKSDTPNKVAYRYTATMVQTVVWYDDGLIPNEPEDSAILTSLRKVRKLHIAAAKKANEKLSRSESLVNEDDYKDTKIDEKMWKAFQADLDASPIRRRKHPDSYYNLKRHTTPVNQFIQAMTQFAFVGFPVLFPDRLGIIGFNEEDLWGFNHLWAVLGYALGIDDQYNIALQPDLETTRKHYQEIFDAYYVPVLFNMDFKSKILVDVLLAGFFRELLPGVLSPTVLMQLLLKQIVGINTPNLEASFTPEDQEKRLTFGLSDSSALKGTLLSGLIANELRSQLHDLAVKYYGEEYTKDLKSRAKYVYYA